MNSEMFEVKESLSNPAEEAYRVLRTNIQFCAREKGMRTIAIVSSGHMEGKTTTTINLAISIAKADFKVLLIDADMRKPVKYKHFGGQMELGLADIITGKIAFEEAVTKTTINNLSMLTSGTKPAYPTEFLNSSVLDEILIKSKGAYDIVIIDTPAMGSYIDGAVIASKADGVLILAKWKSTYYRSIQRLRKQLEKVNANILGIILNNISKREYKDYYIMNYNYEHLRTSFDYEKTVRGAKAKKDMSL